MYTNDDLQNAKDLIENAKSIAIFIHEDADLDALGSATALKGILENLKKDVKIFCPNPVSKQFSWIKYSELVKQSSSFVENKFDLVILCDGNEARRFGLTLDTIQSWKIPVLRLDHHHDKDIFPGVKLSSDEENSSSEVVFKFANFSKWEIVPSAVESLFTGIMADTGWLHYTGSEGSNLVSTLDTVSRLLQIDNCLDRVNLMSTFISELDYIESWKAILDRIKFDKQHGVLYYLIDWDSIKELDPESEMFTEAQKVLRDRLILTIKGVDILIAIKEREKGYFYGSCRSSFEKYNLGKICEQFESGGGHLHAAGFRTQKSLDEILRTIYSGMEKYKLD